MFTKTQLFAAAAVAASASTVFAAPTYDAVDIEVRGPSASKAKDTIAKAASSRAGRKVASEVGKNIYTKVAGEKLDEQKKKDANKKSEHHHGKRDLEDILDELFARGGSASKAKDTIAKAAASRAGRKVASEVGKNVYTKIAGDKLDEQKKKDADKHRNNHQGHGKRELEDFLDELFARGPGTSKVASSRTGSKVTSDVGKNVRPKITGNKLGEQKKTGPAWSRFESERHGKRDLDIIFEALEARELDDMEELYGRGPGASKAKDTIAKAASSRAGRKVATEVGKNIYTKVAGDKLDEQKKKDAAKKNESHRHGKRELEPELLELIARELELYDDLD